MEADETAESNHARNGPSVGQVANVSLRALQERGQVRHVIGAGIKRPLSINGVGGRFHVDPVCDVSEYHTRHTQE